MINLSVAIRWNFTIGGINYVNTCPMDSPLQLLYNLRQMNKIPNYLYQADEQLSHIMDLMEKGSFDEARIGWLTCCMGSFGNEGITSSKNGTFFDLKGDALDYTRILRMCRMKSVLLYEGCSTMLCPNDGFYVTDSSSINTQDALEKSHIVVHIQGGQSIQENINHQYNEFSPDESGPSVQCGLNLSNMIGSYDAPTSQAGIEERSALINSCNGTRKTREQITSMPALLQICVSCANENDRITNTGHFELTIDLHGKTYDLVGALLYNEKHWRSIARHQDRYLVYDGIKESRKNFMWWIGHGRPLTGKWHATILWYFPRQMSDVTELVNFEGEVGYSNEVTVAPVRHLGVNHVTCHNCNETIERGSACLTHKNNSFGVTSIDQYHFPECCPKSGIVQRTLVADAVDVSGYDDRQKEMMKKLIESECLQLSFWGKNVCSLGFVFV